jgi:general secretion pathway protein E
VSPPPPPRAAVPSGAFLSLIPHEFARRHLILSAGDVDGTEQLLIAPTTRPSAVFNVGVRLGRPTHATPAVAEEIATAIDRVYAGKEETQERRADVGSVVVEGSSDLEADLEAAVRDAAIGGAGAGGGGDGDVLVTHGKAPTVRLVDLVIFEALVRGASDVHVQPVRGRTLVRYRLDGVLHTVRELPGSLAAGVVSRIKIMSRLDIAEQRAPQDGRASVTVGGGGGGGGRQEGRRVDLRVSTLPSTYGERVVVRLLDPSRSPHLQSFAALGMPPAVERRYLEQVSKTSGIVLSTGPTGSGKTTTLYATLAWLCAANTRHGVHAGGGCELNVMTVEDPVEYDLSDGGAGTGGQNGACDDAVQSLGGSDGHRGMGGQVGRALAISQTQVDPKKNVTFATGLRHILRQDPDVIMVGEIRDQETARMAVQSSLTGHLVLSTLHTNDAPSAVARLLDLGVEPFLVSSSLSAVLAQRLVRKVHQPCGGRGCSGAGTAAGESGVEGAAGDAGDAGGCVGTGYRGRLGVFELLVLDHGLRELVCRRASAVEIKEAARRAGMVTLREAGTALVRQGVTTEAEVTRVIEAVGGESPPADAENKGFT